MSSLAQSRLSKLFRFVAVLWLCLSTPAVLDIIVDTAGALAGAECCADDCEESGSPCTQQCAHCVCGGHNVTLPSAERTRVVVVRWSSVTLTSRHVGARSAHLDPPFRPPVS